MEEETNTEQEQEKPQSSTLIENATSAAERLEEANEKQEELLNRQEELMARQQLGGKADAGQEPEKPAEETPEDYAKRVMSNTL